MASLHTCRPASHSLGALHRPSVVHAPAVISTSPARLSFHAHLNLRLRKEVGVQVKNRPSSVFASNTGPSEGSDDTKTNGGSSGPPFPTILAGLIVFLFVCWVIGSIVMWLIGLIVHPPPLK
ncbi:hypothetical protein CDL12_11768 [Handroanthus impetiginosus]|uniref:Uncharacterized protein n=1 Tax=Handroanthus impetiginosus TaxID=429701 RepID=A0A2G9HDI8_9LAMI|nr:hypothetical protein CDL12_11768 [Handroanthus impetiginosus]